MNNGSDPKRDGRLRRAVERLNRHRKKHGRPVPIELCFLLHADGTVYQTWPSTGTGQVRRSHDEQVVALVLEDYSRLREIYEEHNKNTDS